MKISEILKKYDTDKVREHHYGDAYDELFNEVPKDLPLEILEIGVQKGGSLLAWKEYFPKANITGVDIKDEVIPEYRSDQVEYIISDIKKWNTEKKFDIIIDDGSHLISDVCYVVVNFANKLNKGGVLVIEDVSNPELWIMVVMSALPVGFRIMCKDYRQLTNRGDDYLIIIKKL